MKLSSEEFVKRFFRIRYYGVIQRVVKIQSIKTIEIEPQHKKVKPKCKKCKCEDIQTVVVVDRYTKVVLGVMTPKKRKYGIQRASPRKLTTRVKGLVT